MNTARSFVLRLALVVAAGSLTACSGSLNDARYPTGSSSVIASSSYEALYVANPDQGTVSRVDVATNTVTEVEVGLEPVRLARAGELVFATLRGERAVAVLSERDGELALQQRIELGAEPYGIVANEKGTTVWVANQLGGTVDEIDVDSLTVTRSFPVQGQPRFLALHPSDKHLYVGSAMGGILSDINLRSGEVDQLALPENTAVVPETFDVVSLSGRITGDMSVSADGTSLAIPVLYVNNVSPVGPPTDIEDPNPPEDGYAGGPDANQRFNPGVVLIVTNQDGKLRPEFNDSIRTTGIGRGQVVAGYPSSATFSPDSETVVLTIEGSDAALVVHVPDEIGDQGMNRSGRGMATDVPDLAGDILGSNMQFGDVETILTGSAPRGITWLEDDRAYVHNGFDYSVADLGFDVPAQLIAERNSSRDGGRGGGRGGVEVTSTMPPVDLGDEFPEDGISNFPAAHESGAPVVVSAEILSDDLALGRQLFFSTSNEQMALPGAGVSCATCHFDARNDGLTWEFDDGSRQTPSLAGEVSLTAPVTWTDGVPTVFDEVMITSQGRMGGNGLSDEDAAKVAAFVDSTPLPDTPLRGADTEQIQRGRDLFESAEVGCADCHSGEAYTDNETYDMYGVSEVRTRGLAGIAASAPYLHDGSAPTLRAVLSTARTGEMGDTGRLSEAQMDDLEAYLKSL